MQSLDKRIGEPVVTHPLTYCFGAASNLIGVLLESEVGAMNEPGDLLIVKKGVSNSDSEKLVYDRAAKKLSVITGSYFESEALCVIGDVIEESFNGS
ncbi:hypothetical protein D3C85_1372880 [compost metagenome]